MSMRLPIFNRRLETERPGKTIHPQGISSPALPKGFHKAKKKILSLS